MRDRFIKYLIDLGYKKTTPSGQPSTVYDYAGRLDRVCREEEISLEDLSKHISIIVPRYDTGGEKEHIGKMSNRSVINALKRFQEFVEKEQSSPITHCRCDHCNQDGRMIIPAKAPVPPPHPDMPASVVEEYQEARSVFANLLEQPLLFFDWQSKN